ncbi:MAG TPA: helix-turn-helix transcriptional regulator [Solirubrobacteraceae bacterium]|nr:helix-turn-helix transcriptional regulator [Solirubrobacteraceae bacterium]
MDTGELLRVTRRSRGLDQAGLARRAGTTQTYVSRVERGDVSPSIRTLERLFHAMGCKLTASVERLPTGNAEVADLRRDWQALTAAERVDQAITLSEFLTGVAAGGVDG